MTVWARATVVAALFALFTLQLTASDHFHNVHETAQCEVCSHAGDTTVVQLVELASCISATPTALALCQVMGPVLAPLDLVIRGPPVNS